MNTRTHGLAARGTWIWIAAGLAALAAGCAAQQDVKDDEANGAAARERAELRREVDRLLADEGAAGEAGEVGAGSDAELLARLEQRLDEKYEARVDPSLEAEINANVAFESALAEELDAPLEPGERAVINEPTGEIVGVYSEQTGEARPILAGTEDELLAGVLSESEAAAAAPPGYERPEPKYVRVRDGQLRDIHFAFDRYFLTDQARQVLRANYEALRASDARIVIEGHCDERGSAEYNLALGDKRARSAYDYLMTLGIDPARMEVISYGEEFPVDARSNPIAWAKNRRAHFRVRTE